MGKKVVTFLTCFALIFSGLQVNLPVVQVKAAQYSGEHFAMEFNGYDSSIMEKSNGWSNGGMFNCTWTENNVSFSNDGIMSLKIDSNGSGGYTGGEYRTRQTFGYGMYQVNMKPIKNPGVVTSFFTYTGPTDGTIWDEIDIEFLGYDTTKVQFNYFTNSVGGHEYVYNLGFDASQEFHTYGFYWGQGTITWYVDGKAVYTVNSSDVPVTPGKIMMNVWPGTGVDDWLKPYNGVTPLTGYYDWAVYDAPGSESQTTTTVAPKPTTQEPTTQVPTTEVVKDGYVSAGANWNELDYWSVYFASGWAGDPTGSYKTGNSYNDFSVNINTASNADWGIQMKTKPLSVEKGKTYVCKVTAQSNMATTNTIRMKDDISGSEILQKLNAGTNNFELQFTAGDSAQIFFDLGQAPAGLEFSVKSFSLEKVQEVTEAPTQEQTTTKPSEPQTTKNTQSSGDDTEIDVSGLTFQTLTCDGNQQLTLAYAIQSSTIVGLVPWYGDGGNTLSLQFSSDSGNVLEVKVNGEDAADGVVTEKAMGLVKINPTKLADNAYSLIRVVTESGEFTLIVKRGTPSETPTTETPTVEVTTVEVTTEAPTEEETTTVVKAIEGGIEINGYQISATAKGMRTVYSVDSTIDGKEVVSSGVIYSLSKYATEEELFVGSPSGYVRSFESTEAGKAGTVFSESDIAESYAMTMKFATKESAEYNESWRVCAYAKLSDGTYVYTDAYTYTIYDIADTLYQKCAMSTKEHHDYLHTDILSIVKKEYEVKEYDNSKSIVVSYE